LDVVFIGDSITQPETPVAAAEEYLRTSAGVAEVRTSNQGHSGHTTLDFLPADGKDAQGVKAAADAFAAPDRELVFSIMLGTNDSACKGPNGSPVAPGDYRANLRTIAGRLLSAYPCAKVVVQYPTWYSTNTHNSACYMAEGLARLRSYGPEIDALVAEFDRTNPGRAYAGSKLGWAYFEEHHETDMKHENGRYGVFFLHPNEQGYKVLGRFWAEAVRRVAVGAEKVVLHVRTDGNDAAGDGSAGRPFATLERARDALRATTSSTTRRIRR